MSRISKWFFGELIGTFILVFVGCGSVAGAVVMDWGLTGPTVAALWGAGLWLAISLTGPMSGAHLNPAITLAFTAYRGFPKKRILGYFAAQFLGAFAAAAALFVLFSSPIATYESDQNIVRGKVGSEATAMIFGEYFPNPSGKELTAERRSELGHGSAFLLEFLGTALLALIVFGFSSPRNRGTWLEKLTPLGIGIGLAVLIVFFGPLTMAGFNPARDLSPRIFSALVGWKAIPFQANGIGWLTVYVLAPILGALLGGGVAQLFGKLLGKLGAGQAKLAGEE